MRIKGARSVPSYAKPLSFPSHTYCEALFLSLSWYLSSISSKNKPMLFLVLFPLSWYLFFCMGRDTKSCALVWYPFYVKPTRDTPTLFLVLIFLVLLKDTNKPSRKGTRKGKELLSFLLKGVSYAKPLSFPSLVSLVLLCKTNKRYSNSFVIF